MKKILALAAAVLCCIGCANDNMIRIENVAAGSLLVNFRAVTYTVAGGNGVLEIKNIPNGSYDFGVTYEIPSGMTPGSLPSGTSLSFQRMSTKWLLLYSATYLDNTYTVYLNKTSSDGGITSP